MKTQKSIQQLANEYIETRDEKTFEILTKRLKPGIKKFLTKYTSDPDRADRIVADTFMKVWTEIDMYNPKWYFSTWVYGIARNKIIIDGKKNYKLKSKFFDDLNMKENLDISTNQITGDASEIDLYENVVKTLYDVSLNIIDTFDEPMRTIVREMKVNNKPNKELQKITNESSCSISILARKGLNKLKDELKKQYPTQYKLYESFLYSDL